MIDEAVIKGVTEVANARMKKAYPLLDKHFCEYEVGVVCEAYCDLTKLIQRTEIDHYLAVESLGEAEFGNMVTGMFNKPASS